MDIHFRTTVFTWLNIFLVVAIAVLFVKFITAGIKYFSSNTQNTNQQPAASKDSLHIILKEYRIKNNMTQEFVAQALGVSRQAVSKWENGTSRPSTANLIAIAKLYNIPPEEILAKADSM